MLNLYNKLSNKREKKSTFIANDYTIKSFPASNREWNNSIYVFNKNFLNLLPIANKISMKFIKSYFNLYNTNLESKLRKSVIRKRFKRLSSNKIYVSNGTFKHTNNKIIINLFVYNRQKFNYIFLINRNFKVFFANYLITKLNSLKENILKFQNEVEKNRYIVFQILKKNKKINLNNMEKIFNKYYNIKYYNKIIKKIFNKYKNYFLYKQLLYINKSKFNYNYLSYLNEIIKKIYNKSVEFNIINLKYFYLNSDILTESIMLKITRDRRKLIEKLNYLFMKSKIIKTDKFIIYEPIEKNTLSSKKKIDNMSYKILKNLYKKKKNTKKTVLDILKYKRLSGVRLEAKGRLTRRYTASRSVSKLIYKGNLINIDASYLGLPSTYLRGNLNPNVQHTKLNSKTRIGSFGLKGWISGY
jgi:hypothetical protein